MENAENPERSAAARAPPTSSAPWSSTTSGMRHAPNALDQLPPPRPPHPLRPSSVLLPLSPLLFPIPIYYLPSPSCSPLRPTLPPHRSRAPDPPSPFRSPSLPSC
ncbi:hypothetical protein DFH09DRAFT_1357944, partial [Mycena vulgaris]